MIFSSFANRLNRRLYRRTYRRTLQRWCADGGDDKLRYDYRLGRDSFVMDLGGYEGGWSSRIHAQYGCRIGIFEPVSAFASAIEQRFRGKAGIRVYQYGLGGSSRTETIYLWGAGTSTFRKRSQREEIKIVDVERWLQEHEVERVQLMKVNIEGGEYELMERLLQTGSISRFENIQIQFHNIAVESARRMERIQEGMRRTHVPTYQYEFVWESWARERQSNA